MTTTELEVKTPLYGPSQDELQQEEAEDKREIATVFEDFFLTNHDTTGKRRVWDMDLSTDSFVWCYTGGRGAGKTTAMTADACLVCYKWDMRLVSNYPIDFTIVCRDGSTRTYSAEPLDFYKLLCFDADYKNCLILIDEAPDVISHMASMTWKNRLLAMFVRQLRKNRNSLFMCAQDFGLIDKSMRWQTDVIINCSDASLRYGWDASERGKMILVNMLDNSGKWTGKTWEQRLKTAQRSGHSTRNIGLNLQLFPRVLWGDKTHKPVYDTYYQQDVWESLKKVDMKQMSYNVGKDNLSDSDYKEKSAALINSLPETVMRQTDFWNLIDLTLPEKQACSKLFKACGIETTKRDNKNQRVYDFTDFDRDKFLRGK